MPYLSATPDQRSQHRQADGIFACAFVTALACLPGCSSTAFGQLRAEIRTIPPGPSAVRNVQAQFCARLADELQSRSYVNQFWAVGITATGVAETAGGSGAALVAAQMSDTSENKHKFLQVGAALTAIGLASLGVAAIFDWNGLAKKEKVAAAHMAEASARILSAKNDDEANKWWTTCTESAVKVGEDIPDVKNPNSNGNSNQSY